MELKEIKKIEKLINKFKKEQLPNHKSPYHPEAEIAAGFKYFIIWLKESINK